jgi:hypothetical protein
MDGRSLGPRFFAGAWLHQSPCGSTGHESSLPLGITSRLAGIRGGPQGAVSDVSDPTERLTSLTAFRLAKHATLYGSQPDADSTQGVSPDKVDSICLATSPPTKFLRAAGRIWFNGFGPRPWLPRPAAGCALDAARGCVLGPHLGPPGAAFLWTSDGGWFRDGLAEGSWAAARWRLALIILLSIICKL